MRGLGCKATWYLRDAVDKRDGQRPFPRVEMAEWIAEWGERDEVGLDVRYNGLARSRDGACGILRGILVMARTETVIGKGSGGVARWYDCLHKSCGGSDGCTSGISCIWGISSSGTIGGGNCKQCQRRSSMMEEYYLADWLAHYVQVKPH